MPANLSPVPRCAALAAALILPGLAVAAPVDEMPPRPRIHVGESAPVRAWGKAMDAGNLAALAAMHGKATIAFPPDKTEVKGADAIMKGYAALFAKYTVRVAVDEAYWVAEPPLVVSWGRTTLTLHPKAGGPDIVSHTRFTDAAIKVEGGWRYVVDQASVPKGP